MAEEFPQFPEGEVLACWTVDDKSREKKKQTLRWASKVRPRSETIDINDRRWRSSDHDICSELFHSGATPSSVLVHRNAVVIDISKESIFRLVSRVQIQFSHATD